MLSEDNATGKLSDERFAQLSGDYEREQTELKEQTLDLRAELEGFNADRSGGERVQQVDIYLNFIGKFDVSIVLPEPTPEKIAEAEKKERFRAKRREYERRYIAKKRARLEEEQEQNQQDEVRSA